jgi:hypothetical protein
MNRGGSSVFLPMPHRRGIPPQKTRKSCNPSTDGRELRYCYKPQGSNTSSKATSRSTLERVCATCYVACDDALPGARRAHQGGSKLPHSTEKLVAQTCTSGLRLFGERTADLQIRSALPACYVACDDALPGARRAHQGGSKLPHSTEKPHRQKAPGALQWTDSGGDTAATE